MQMSLCSIKMARLKELFTKEIKPNLKQQFGYKNSYMVPEIQKIILKVT